MPYHSGFPFLVLWSRFRHCSQEAAILPTPEKATFLIADITGYTKFLAVTEIAHAQDIVSDFLNTVTNSLGPDFLVAKYEGDAVFLYAPGPHRDSSYLEDLVEGAYIAFRRRQRDVRQASACTCAACIRMSDLDFKFVVYEGEMVRQRIGDREELAGRDVILIHRLLKNSVGQTFGPAAYALYSAACFEAGIDPTRRGLLEHVETDETLGPMPVWYRDLAAVWSAEASRRSHFISPEESFRTWEFTLPGTPRAVWERITVPGLWQEWWFAEDITEVSGGGRRGTGTQNHCAHGEHVTIEETLDWHC